MSTTDQFNEFEVNSLGSDPTLVLELGLQECEALRTRLLKPAADGTLSLDDPLVNGVLTKLGRALDAIHAAENVRRELEEMGLDVSHLSDEQVHELGRRVSDAVAPGHRN
jgi:hypothetical protein